MSKEKIEEMIEALKKCSCVYTECEQECSQCSNEELYDETLNHIARTLYEAGYRKQEWISVEERLPETKLTKVTIASQDIASGKTMETEERTMNTSELVVVVYKAHLDGKFSMFVGLDQLVDGRWFYTDSVTHWMPLPEAPKMKGGAE